MPDDQQSRIDAARRRLANRGWQEIGGSYGRTVVVRVAYVLESDEKPTSADALENVEQKVKNLEGLRA